MTSLGARATVLLLRLINRRKVYATSKSLLRGIAQTRRAGPARPHSRLSQTLRIEQSTFQGQDLYRLRPRGDARPLARVMYLHGGACVRPITRFHWAMLAEWVDVTGFEFIVPLYPLAPERSGLAALQWVREVFRQESASAAPMLLMGDSAGAGLALALAAALRDSGEPLPKRLILITPWVDVEVPHPHAARLAPHDPMLGIEGVREAGRLYAGNLPTSHPSISPARGNLNGLPAMTLFVGTRDILGPDAIEFARRGLECGCEVDLRVEQGMVHVWPLLNFAEAKRTRAQIAAMALAAVGANPNT